MIYPSPVENAPYDLPRLPWKNAPRVSIGPRLPTGRWPRGAVAEDGETRTPVLILRLESARSLGPGTVPSICRRLLGLSSAPRREDIVPPPQSPRPFLCFRIA